MSTIKTVHMDGALLNSEQDFHKLISSILDLALTTATT
jgi:hypothetical protein